MSSMSSFKRKGHSGGGGHGGAWFISFADLMSLLMAFFVMLLSFSIQDQEKLNMAAGSVQHAFGIQPSADLAGIVERDGNPLREYLKEVTPDEMQPGDGLSPKTPGDESGTYATEKTPVDRAKQFAMAAVSLKQAWQDLPDITSISDHIVIEDTPDGLNIVIADQEGRAMFPEGSKYPLELTRKAFAAMAPSLQKLPNRVRVSGFTASGHTYDNARYGPWELSFDRANITRQILEEFGMSNDHIESVVGRADTDPIYPDDPYLSGNERVSITLLYEKPPVPVNLHP